MKRKTVFSVALCALLCFAFCFIAFADGHDTPVIPIHTKHTYRSSITAFPTCTQEGERTYTCSVCGNTYTEVMQPYGHLLYYNGNQTWEGIELKCSYCDETEVCTAASLEEKWNIDYVNDVPYRTGYNDSGYLDLDCNGLINGKDYAMILKLRNNEEKLIEKHERSLIGSETQEEL
ncbi:MAG: hypothetical protein IJR70_03690 [Eubacterium sp.]|nr:hypothetical protein [Eubacterium sp.]